MVAKVLEHYADLLDIQGGKPFKVRSYRQAAKTLAGLSRPITDVVDSEEEDWADRPAVDESMAGPVVKFVVTGGFEKHVVNTSTWRTVRKWLNRHR